MMRILVVEAESAIRETIRAYLASRGCDVRESATWASAVSRLHTFHPEVAIVDCSLPDVEAEEIIPRLHDESPNTSVIVLTGHALIELAVKAMNQGAEHFLTKPIDPGALWVVVQRAAENRATRRVRAAGSRGSVRNELNPFLGASRLIGTVADSVAAIVDTDLTVLVQGETGVGKGILARWIHDHGPRAREPFCDINCSGLSRDLLESELFGYEKGAFTGATAAKQGLLEVADHGTMFLDEIGDADPLVQPKLLKVTEDMTLRRLGAVRARRVDVRLIAATHYDLQALQRDGRFRSDLYFRISVLPIVLPPLRERREDIPIIAFDLLTRIADELGLPVVTLSPEAQRALGSHAWPGNIRELRNVLERAVLLTRRSIIEESDLFFIGSPSDHPAIGDPRLTLGELERRHIGAILELMNGSVDAAAARLGISRSALYARLKSDSFVKSENRTAKS
ncbi:MAG: sigma-54 dependent transcriptional regulator [Thermoanaerobaculia bacterium]|jgi:DNA-binding NtrC family response regulator